MTVAGVVLPPGPHDPWEAAARRFESVEAASWSPLDLAMRLDRRIIRTGPLSLVDDAVQKWVTGERERTIVVLPPQEGKTVQARYGVLQALRYDPHLRVGVASYSDRIAKRIPRWVRNDITAFPGLGLRLAPDQKAAHDWRLDNGVGGCYAAGYSGSWSGVPVDRFVLDDMFKDRKDADSEVTRDNVYDWYTSTATARLAEGGAILAINTRWHHDDLIGRLLEHDPDGWHVVHIPAQADPEVLDPDPLDRQPGEFMESARGRTRQSWEKRKREADDEWEPVYQGNPAPPGGRTFDPDKLRKWSLSADGRFIVAGIHHWQISECRRFVTVDTAQSTKTGADYTVASAWAVPPDGTLVLLDARRRRVPDHEQIDLARPLAQTWTADAVYVESTMAGTRLIRDAISEGLQVDDLKADRSKTLRAALAAKWVQAGRVWFPTPDDRLEVSQDPLASDVVKELRQFPNGRHDDFVDTLAYAAAVTLDTYLPPDSGRGEPERDPVAEGLAGAFAADPVDDLWTRPF